MASLGARTMNELIGRVELLRQKKAVEHPKANTLNLRRMLADVSKDDPTAPRFHTRDRNDGFIDRPLDDIILQDANEAINHGQTAFALLQGPATRTARSARRSAARSLTSTARRGWRKARWKSTLRAARGKACARSCVPG